MLESTLVAGVAVFSAAAGTILPSIMRARRPARVPVVLLCVPALTVGSWWIAEVLRLGDAKVGFTFFGAIPAAALSDLVVLAFYQVSASRHVGAFSRTVSAIGTSILVGMATRILLPGLSE